MDTRSNLAQGGPIIGTFRREDPFASMVARPGEE